MAVTINGTTGMTTPTGVFSDASGNVGVGTTSPTQKLTISGGTQVQSTNPIYFFNTDYLIRASTGLELQTADFIRFVTNAGANERMRIDSSGNVLVGAITRTGVSGLSGKLYSEQSASDSVSTFYNTNATPFGLAIGYSNAPNGTSSEFLFCRDSSAQRASIRSNGGLANFSANNVNLSDERLKTDITPAKSYLDTICSIPVVTFKYKDQTDEELNLGVIAQSVDAVAPELVDHSGFGEAPEGESPYLAVYQTDLQYALMKCIQEQQELIKALTSRIETLEAK